MSPRVESAAFFLTCAAIGFIIIAAIVLLSRLTTERLSTLENLRLLLVNYPAAVIGTIGIGNEIYQAYKYGTAFNWSSILTLLGITAATSQLRSGQKTAESAVKNTAATADLILNTMPPGPKNPVPATRTQVEPDVVPPLPPHRPTADVVAPQPVPTKDSS